ncbi:MAG: hypothetical protein U0325_23510 [Polyangiales bacterium]
MRLRPLLVLTPLAASLVVWFTARMWFGHDPSVWRASALLGGWAPVLAAALVAYLWREGHREDSVGAAWLARALGVHCALLWMVGVSDWLRGPPNTPPAWDIDSGTPLVFLAFAPCLALCIHVAFRVVRLHGALRAPPPRRVLAPAAWHYRTVPDAALPGGVRVTATTRRWLPAAVCASTVAAVVAGVLPSAPGVVAAGAVMGAVCTRGTMIPAMLSLAALSARAVLAPGVDGLAMRWPALLVASLWAYTVVASRAGQRMTTQRTWG